MALCFDSFEYFDFFAYLYFVIYFLAVSVQSSCHHKILDQLDTTQIFCRSNNVDKQLNKDNNIHSSTTLKKN